MVDAQKMPSSDMWLGGGFASIMQNETMMKVHVDYTNVSKVLAIVGEAVTDSPLRRMLETPERWMREKSMPRLW